MFGDEQQNADGGHPCLAFANAGHGGPCIAAVTAFGNDANSVEFGPIQPGGGTISQLQAVTSGTATGQTITVFDNTGATALTCTNTAGSTCSDTTHSVPVAGGDFLQVQVTGGTASPWKVTFVLG
jgi:hypothetical protein